MKHHQEGPFDTSQDPPTFVGSPNVEVFRSYLRQHKSFDLKEKVMSEHEAVARFVSDGDYIGFELYGTVRCPMSIAREIVRQRKKHLKVLGQGILEVDLLLAAGLVDYMDITYVGYEVYGVSPILRRAVEQGKVRTADWSNGAIAWRLKAAAMGVPFIPIRSMLGSEMLKTNGALTMTDPYTGLEVVLLPALVLDVGIIHVHRADPYGNAQIDGIQGFASELARASKKLIISAEEIVDPEEIRKYPERTIIPYFLVDAVVHAPFGSHPGEMAYMYERDEPHLKMYLQKIRTEEGAQEYLEEYVYSTANHEEYIEKVGGWDRMKVLSKLAVKR